LFKAVKEVTSPDKGNLQIDYMSEVTENNNNAHSDHEGREAAHMQTPNGRPNNDPLDNKPRKILLVPPPCRQIQSKLPKSPPVSRLPAPFPPHTPTANLLCTGHVYLTQLEFALSLGEQTKVWQSKSASHAVEENPSKLAREQNFTSYGIGLSDE